ncbi:acylneuraminate cytidylyltransferase family protein [Flavobacterium sp. ANB]|uniref:acylneuraminate cytidylyltransferase family protein n=1 Tax=unclassified Flavobacterium TaxID=196869 RepID=UPI0012B8A7D7|nr:MULTISPECIES: acylneuraminate cytidylyltransferase family protein [unclassified Flavobacterium]MBF4517627.1 acylneuraminate cytidylyltransferase family protein [Flavobacterium sp. ANB]MTD70354.1 acylneuraminate cytidylyltransferase family protein [Flavobacterium sp. LC2016-13]
MKILTTICARGGSKGIPGKNIKKINNKPLIGYSIEFTEKLKEKFDIKVALSTDDEAIKRTAESFGVFTDYVRPDYLATDSAGKMETIKDLLLYEESLVKDKYDFILDLDVTSPLRNLEDIEKALDLMIANPEAKNLFSVNHAVRNPYFNMVEENSNGFYSLVKTNPDGSFMTRQSAPKVYDLNASFYWYRRSFFDSDPKSAITDKSLIFAMDHICFDLDHSVDFLFMEYLLINNKLDFQL